MRTSRWIRALCGALLVSGVLTIAASPAAAAAVTVSTEAQLRTALADPATTMVTLANSIDLVDCSPSGGDLDRSGALVLDGGGFTLRQTCAGERVLESIAGTLTLQHVTITGGDQIGTAAPGSDQGGGVRATNDLVLDDTIVSSNTLSGGDAYGGGVYTNGTLSTTSSAISDNTATATGGTHVPVFGGGAYSTNAQLDGTTVEDNAIHATSDVGAASAIAKGGGVFAELTMHVTGSTIDGNTIDVQGSSVAAEGGGLFATDLTIGSSTVGDNGISATGDPSVAGLALGGGIRAAGALVLDSTTVTGNTATSDGFLGNAGTFGGGVEADGAITLTASHVDANTASSTAGSYGAGVLSGAGQDVTITDSTVDGNTAVTTDATPNNSAANGGGVALVANHSSSIILDLAGTVHLVRSSVSSNVERTQAAGLTFAIGGGVVADDVVLESSHVDANELRPSSTGSQAAGWGGGVLSTTLTATDSTLDRNVVAPDGTEDSAEGGGTWSADGSVVLTDSSASGNTVTVTTTSGVAECAGLLVGALTLTRATVSDNTASGATGAVGGGACGGRVAIDSSTLSGNAATGTAGESWGGGGVFGNGTIRDSTVSGNSVSGSTAHGGALTHAPWFTSNEPGDLALVNSTVTGNEATGAASSGGGIDLPGQIGGLPPDAGTVSLIFSTVAGNTAGSGANIGASAADGTVRSFGSTISAPLGGGTNCDGFAIGDLGDTQVTDTSCGTAAAADPQLGALGDHGGPTLTMLPSATSPLLDQVPADACLALVTSDQRGITRPQGTACDIGAVERAVPPPPTPEPTPLPTAADAPTAAPAVVAEPRFTG